MGVSRVFPAVRFRHGFQQAENSGLFYKTRAGNPA
jgi:hypothetical protein